MQSDSLKWRGVGLGVIFMACVLAILLTVTPSVATENAQGDIIYPDPTATPTDPAWRAFATVREAIEEERSVDLTFVNSYTWEQDEFTYGIEYDCIDDFPANDVTPAYFGWTFRITDLRGTTHQARVSFDLKAVAVCTNVTENDTTVANPVENPNLPAPVAGSGAVGGFELGGHILGLGPQTVTYMNQAGMTWVKQQLRYNLGDSGSIAQSMINDAHSKGFKILIGIVGQPSQMGSFTSYIQSYSTFVGEVAALGADAIEVWNEPNIGREWPTGQISGANYAQLLASAFNSIKSAHSSTIVVSGAPAPTGAEAIDPANIKNDDRFLAEMAAAGAGQFFDCLGLHYNEGIVAPSASSGDPRDNYPTRYFGSMLARGRQSFPGKPVCWTELGYLSGEGMGAPIPTAFAWADGVTVAQHAAWLAEAASLSAQNGVRLMIVWNVNFELWGSDPMGGYAKIRPPGNCPACGQLGTVMVR
jgi:hypothetical protein